MSKDTEIAEEAYGAHNFRLKWNEKYVAGVSKVSSLTHESSATQQVISGQSEFSAITLERGVTFDPAFVQWATTVWSSHDSAIDYQQGDTGNQHLSLLDFREDIVLELFNEDGQKVIAYNIYRCWASEFVTLPEIDLNGYAVAISILKLEHEGWERDTSVQQ